jgi:hypothetical protein
VGEHMRHAAYDYRVGFADHGHDSTHRGGMPSGSAKVVHSRTKWMGQ